MRNEDKIKVFKILKKSLPADFKQISPFTWENIVDFGENNDDVPMTLQINVIPLLNIQEAAEELKTTVRTLRS